MFAKIVTAALTSVIAGCSFVGDSEVGTVFEGGLARQVLIEVEDLERGLPCRVIVRRSPDVRDILWRAQFEEGFCRRKAKETRSIMQERGLTCRAERDDERRRGAAQASGPPYVVAAWRCLEDQAAPRQLIATRPPVPVARPTPKPGGAIGRNDGLLRSIVERDLAAIGQDVIGDDTAVKSVFGDLDDDGIDDAVVVLTREIDHDADHRMLMAYLQNDDKYNLVDVWIIEPSVDRPDDGFAPRIENGEVHLGDCCVGGDSPMTLVLENRKLAYSDGG